MGRKKLSLNAYWLHVHSINDKLVKENGKYNFEEAEEISDGLWKVDSRSVLLVYLGEFRICLKKREFSGKRLPKLVLKLQSFACYKEPIADYRRNYLPALEFEYPIKLSTPQIRKLAILFRLSIKENNVLILCSDSKLFVYFQFKNKKCPLRLAGLLYSRLLCKLPMFNIGDVTEFTRCSNLRGVENFLPSKFTQCEILHGVKNLGVSKYFSI